MITELKQDSGDNGQDLAPGSNRPDCSFIQAEEEWQDLLILQDGRWAPPLRNVAVWAPYSKMKAEGIDKMG